MYHSAHSNSFSHKKEVHFKIQTPGLHIWTSFSSLSAIHKFYYVPFLHPPPNSNHPYPLSIYPPLNPIVQITHPTPEPHLDFFSLIPKFNKAQSLTVSAWVVDLNYRGTIRRL